MSQQAAEQHLREGRVDAALAALQDAVRAQPGDARLRIFLFQILSVAGQWQRALNQLDVCAEMDPGALGMREMYRDAIACEALRAEVFAGKRAPMLFGEPEPWLALLIESLLRSGRNEAEASARLREQAFEQAPTSGGTVDGQAFEWIADADSRMGPVIEAIINGRYYWVPFNRLLRLATEPPEDLRDFVWLPGVLQFTNGGEVPALLPARYPGSSTSGDGLIQLGRKTDWLDQGNDTFHGLGQRLLATDSGEYPLMQCREILINDPGGEAAHHDDPPAGD